MNVKVQAIIKSCADDERADGGVTVAEIRVEATPAGGLTHAMLRPLVVALEQTITDTLDDLRLTHAVEHVLVTRTTLPPADIRGLVPAIVDAVR